jgi:hypothetical protein
VAGAAVLAHQNKGKKGHNNRTGQGAVGGLLRPLSYVVKQKQSIPWEVVELVTTTVELRWPVFERVTRTIDLRWRTNRDFEELLVMGVFDTRDRPAPEPVLVAAAAPPAPAPLTPSEALLTAARWNRSAALQMMGSAGPRFTNRDRREVVAKLAARDRANRSRARSPRRVP